MICECCKSEHDGRYGSGRFCSSKCARSFSTKKNRSDINTKIGKKRSLSKHSEVEKICEQCKKIFSVPWNKRNQKFCSQSCSSTYKNINGERSLITNSKISSKLKEAYDNGKPVKGGKTKWYSYKNLKVQGTFELRTCKILDSWKKSGKIIDWEYTNDRINYIGEDGKSHSYLLDFKIFVDETFYYIEVKGFKTKKDDLKWKAAKDQNLNIEVWYLNDIIRNETITMVD